MEPGDPFRPFKRFHGLMVPEELSRYDGIGAGEKLCWGRLARYEGSNGRAFPSMQTLGSELGVSARQARLYVAELERQGFLKREAVAGKTNRFVFLWHQVFEQPRKNISAPPRQDSSAPPRQEFSAPGGEMFPPKRVSEVSRRQGSQYQESQITQGSDNSQNDDDHTKGPEYASDKDELIALIRDSTKEQPDSKLIRQIPEFLELRGGTVKQYLEDIRPRLRRLRKRPTAAFFYRHAERWRGESSRPAPEPRAAQQASQKCPCKYGQIQNSDGNWEVCQNCDTGRHLARVSARRANEQGGDAGKGSAAQSRGK